jgi:hypothetical protein
MPSSSNRWNKGSFTAKKWTEQYRLLRGGQWQFWLWHYRVEPSILRSLLWRTRRRRVCDEVGRKWDRSLYVFLSFTGYFILKHIHPEGSFYRAAVPQDILQGSPNPANWGVPSAALEPGRCDPLKFFVNHSMIFGMRFSSLWITSSQSFWTL